jgi:DNA-binding NarL/FixJ family response regulator
MSAPSAGPHPVFPPVRQAWLDRRREEALAPDLLLLDLELPGLDGLAVLRLVKARPAAPRVVVVTLHDHEPYRVAAAAAGADGFVAKRAFTTALGPLLRDLFRES